MINTLEAIFLMDQIDKSVLNFPIGTTCLSVSDIMLGFVVPSRW